MKVLVSEMLDKRHQTSLYKIVTELKTIGGKSQEPTNEGRDRSADHSENF